MRYPFTANRIAVIKRTENNNYWQECGRIGTPMHGWSEYNMVQPDVEDSMSVTQKVWKQPKSPSIYG